jgi:hypothetical protein
MTTDPDAPPPGDDANEPAAPLAPSFTGLPFGDLIGGPLNAAADAQARLARTTADFIRTIGAPPTPGQDDPAAPPPAAPQPGEGPGLTLPTTPLIPVDPALPTLGLPPTRKS